MIYADAARLAEFSMAVRESTLKRLKIVPAGSENWRPVSEAMSFADLTRHLTDCDKWLFEKLKSPGLQSISGQCGLVHVENRVDYDILVDELSRVGEMRAKLIRALTEKDLGLMIFDDRVFGKVEVWWLIMRGTLDHEIHHRGQIAVYLSLLHNLGK
jgi:hypothetical protein